MSDRYIMSTEVATNEDVDYDVLLAYIQNTFAFAVKSGDEPLFTTDAEGLYDLFLENIPEDSRQTYECRTCRHFVEKYGGLVRISDKGTAKSALWSAAPNRYAPAITAMKDAVAKAAVTGVFIPDRMTLGNPRTGEWTHFSLKMPPKMVHIAKLKTADEKMSEKSVDFRILNNALSKFSMTTAEIAVNLLQSNALYRSEKVLGMATWFLSVHQDIKGRRNRRNILWKKVATAPDGFCHIPSSVVGSLMEDIENGLPMDEVKRRFEEKMNPTKYQRPQAAPTAGNVAQAEKIVEKLGLERSLRRRYARLEELQAIWKPRIINPPKVAGGVFSGLQTKQDKRKNIRADYIPEVKMTFDKFLRTVLPKARKIQYHATDRRDTYGAIVTAVFDDAPPILRWDSAEDRNPFSWYVYNLGSYPSEWNLTKGLVDVTAIVAQPSMWKVGFESHGQSAFFMLDGCRDLRWNGSGLALFPGNLRGELREIRSTIESYSREHDLEGADEATACGIRLQANTKSWNYKFRVTTDLGVTDYVLDRWD